MMMLNVGSYSVKSLQWESYNQMLNYLKKCTLGMVELQDNSVYNASYYSIIIKPFSTNKMFGIGCPNSFSNLPPLVIVNYEALRLMIVTENSIAIVDIQQSQLISEMRVEHDFIYHIYTFQHLRIHDFYLAQTELKLIAINSQGRILWIYSHDDVIASVTLKENHIYVYSMDSSKETILNLTNGTLNQIN
jgi:hypothetical protein